MESFGGTVKIYEIEGVEPEKVMAAMEELREEGFNGIALTPSEDQLLRARINQYQEEYGIPVVTFKCGSGRYKKGYALWDRIPFRPVVRQQA